MPSGVQYAQPQVANMPAVLNGTLLMSPSLPRIASNLPITNAVLAAQQAQAIATGQKPATPSVSDLLDLEHDLYLDPVNTLRRHFRVYVLPVAVSASGGLLAAPQRDCVPFRLYVPAGSTPGATISQLQSGVDQYFATADAVPAAVFGTADAFTAGAAAGAGSLSGESAYLRPIVTQVGKNVTALSTLASGTVCGMLCFDLSADGIAMPPMGRPMKIGFKQTIVHAAAAATISRSPQKGFRIRRISINTQVTNWDNQIDGTHGISITGVFVGNNPQTEANGSLPASMFASNQLGGWIDGDFCKVGKTLSLTVVNNEAANDISVEGEFEGDTLDD